MIIQRDPEVILAIESQLGIPGKYGALWTARRLLREIWKDKPQVIRDTTFDLRELPFTSAAQNLLWRRDLTPAMLGKWVHHFDKNSAYLSACRSIYTGIGDPVYQQDEEVTLSQPGIYRVTWEVGQSEFDGTRYPYIIQPGQEWVTLDVLRFASSRGYRFQVHEAYVFPEKTRVLEKWAEKLWNARAALKAQNQTVAASIINDVAHVGVGGFVWSEHQELDLIHPNWWADVVGGARVRMLANLVKYGPAVCIRTDGLFYVTREPDIRQAVPGILDREHESGGYKIPRGWTSFQLDQVTLDRAGGVTHGELSSLFKHTCGTWKFDSGHKCRFCEVFA